MSKPKRAKSTGKVYVRDQVRGVGFVAYRRLASGGLLCVPECFQIRPAERAALAHRERLHA